MPGIHINSSARNYLFPDSSDAESVELASRILSFHKSLPDYNATPLTPLPSLAAELGVKAVFVKDESSRFGLPAYKILGASWGIYRLLCQICRLPLTTSLDEVGACAKQKRVVLHAATDGNHGRAVARMAGILGMECHIFVPRFTDVETRDKISGEGAEVTRVDGDYDKAVSTAWDAAADISKGGKLGLLVQDNAFEGYAEVPQWIVEGYGTMMGEIEHQLQNEGLQATVMVTPIGVGSLGNAVVKYCKSKGSAIKVFAVEPEVAACLHTSLLAEKETSVTTGSTIMDGMCCGTVSPVSWPYLRNGVDVSVTVTDVEAHEAVRFLHKNGIMAGPCSGGTLAGLRKVSGGRPVSDVLDSDSVVVVLSTEGDRKYIVPEQKAM